jgi:hypothetical protein
VLVRSSSSCCAAQSLQTAKAIGVKVALLVHATRRQGDHTTMPLAALHESVHDTFET